MDKYAERIQELQGAEGHIAVGDDAFKRGDFANAVAAYSEAVKVSSDWPFASFLLPATDFFSDVQTFTP